MEFRSKLSWHRKPNEASTSDYFNLKGTALDKLPFEVIIRLLREALQCNGPKGFEDFMEAFPKLNDIVLVITDSPNTISTEENQSPLIKLPKAHTTTIVNYGLLKQSERLQRHFKILAFQYCDRDQFRDLNYSQSCRYARMMSRETCVVFQCDDSARVTSSIMKYHCENAHVPVMVQVSRVSTIKTRLINGPNDAFHGQAQQSLSGFTRVHAVDVLSLYINSNVLNYNHIKQVSVELKNQINTHCNPQHSKNPALISFALPSLETFTVSFPGSRIPNMRVTYAAYNRYVPVDTSHFILRNTTWSYKNPYGSGCGCIRRANTDPASWAVTENHADMTMNPGFKNVCLEGIPDAMLPLLNWTWIRNLYWKRLCPRADIQTSTMNANIGPPEIASVNLRRLKIFSVVRDAAANGGYKDELPVFKSSKLTDLTLVGLEGSDSVWDLSSLIDEDYFYVLETLNLINMDTDKKLVMRQKHLTAARRTITNLTIWGYQPKFIYSSKAPMPKSYSFSQLKTLVLDLSCVESSPLHLSGREFTITEKTTSDSCSIKLHLPEVQFPKLETLRLVTPESKLSEFGVGVQLGITVPSSCKRVMCCDLIPISKIIINGKAGRYKHRAKKDLDLIKRTHSHSIWKYKRLHGRFVKLTNRSQKILTYEEWFDYYDTLKVSL